MSVSIAQPLPAPTHEPDIERAIREVECLLQGEYALSTRATATLLLQGDEETLRQVERQQGAEDVQQILSIRNGLESRLESSVTWHIVQSRLKTAQQITRSVLTNKTAKIRPRTLADWIGWLCMHPVMGFPLLAFVLYWGLYQFVGVFAAGTVVDYIENTLFAEYVNPFVTNIVQTILPWKPLQELFVGEYGIWTLGVTYAIALILPIVTFFFLVFAVLEDSGYLPRLAMLIDRSFKKLGLNGRAVIPIVLGFGCDTMATVVTRVLETPRERILTTFLLSLTIPCSAQLGVVLALLADHPKALLIWAGLLVLVFLLAGYLAAKVLPGTPTPFSMEIPPMRLPSLGNVIRKTVSRLQWYFLEVFPLFIVASIFVWIGQMTGLFDVALRALQPVIHALQLPSEAAVAFLFGFFRRDYGAAGLYQLNDQHRLTGNQLLVSSVVLTLFVPCVAQFLVTVKERGTKMAIGMFLFTVAFALLVGVVLSRLLALWGINV